MRAASPISVPHADPYIRRIAGVCDMHGVAVGSPGQLEGFLKALDEDKHLAMDFWAVMGKMSDEGPAYLAGRTLNAKMLEVVVEAVTGVSVADILAAGEPQRQVVAQLVRLLAGEDIHSPVVVDDEPDVEATPDVESRKPMARAESPVSAPIAGTGSASSLRPFRYSAAEVERSERSPVELRPVHREGDEPPAADIVEDGAGSGQRSAGGREGAKGAPIRWPYEAAAQEPFVQQQPVQRPFVQPREVPRTSGPESIPRARAAFTNDAPPAANKPAPTDNEELERLRLVHWVLENFPAVHGGAAVRAEADYYGTKLNAAEMFAKYAEHLSRVQEPAKDRTIAERPGEGDRVEERISQASRVVEGAEAAKLAYWRLPEGAVDPNAPLVHHPAAEVLPAKTHDLREAEGSDRLMRVPLSDFADDEEEVDRQKRVFKLVLSGIVVMGILVGLMLAQIHLIDGWRNLRGSINDKIAAMTTQHRSALNIPNDLVVDPEPASPAPAPQAVRRTVRPPQTQPRSTTPARSVYGDRMDRPLVRVLPAPNDRIDPVAGARAGAAYDTVLASNGAGSGTTPVGPVVVPAATMEANLISSRLPVYPEGARAGDGRVVLQAIISKSGTVGHLRVLSGDPALRGAAADAVAKWRYRPYMVNYEPVEVSTTVIIDFNRGQ